MLYYDDISLMVKTWSTGQLKTMSSWVKETLSPACYNTRRQIFHLIIIKVDHDALVIAGKSLKPGH
jgi:hypothetical protein